jgi:hypothetical protein
MAPSPIYVALAVVYFAGLILVGIWSTRRGGDSNQYLNATSSLPLWVCATACIAANSAAKSGLSKWDPKSGARICHIDEFHPTKHHLGAGELAQLSQGAIARWHI